MSDIPERISLREVGPRDGLQNEDPVPTPAKIALIDRLGQTGVGRIEAVSFVRAEAIEIASRMAANSPIAVKAAKRAIRQGADIGLAAGLEVEDAAWRTAALSADRREGIAAFNEKRQPQWPGE